MRESTNAQRKLSLLVRTLCGLSFLASAVVVPRGDAKLDETRTYGFISAFGDNGLSCPWSIDSGESLFIDRMECKSMTTVREHLSMPAALEAIKKASQNQDVTKKMLDYFGGAENDVFLAVTHRMPAQCGGRNVPVGTMHVYSQNRQKMVMTAHRTLCIYEARGLHTVVRQQQSPLPSLPPLGSLPAAPSNVPSPSTSATLPRTSQASIEPSAVPIVSGQASAAPTLKSLEVQFIVSSATPTPSISLLSGAGTGSAQSVGSNGTGTSTSPSASSGTGNGTTGGGLTGQTPTASMTPTIQASPTKSGPAVSPSNTPIAAPFQISFDINPSASNPFQVSVQNNDNFVFTQPNIASFPQISISVGPQVSAIPSPSMTPSSSSSASVTPSSSFSASVTPSTSSNGTTASGGLQQAQVNSSISIAPSVLPLSPAPTILNIPNLPAFTAVSINVQPVATLTVINPSIAALANLTTSVSASPSVSTTTSVSASVTPTPTLKPQPSFPVAILLPSATSTVGTQPSDGLIAQGSKAPTNDGPTIVIDFSSPSPSTSISVSVSVSVSPSPSKTIASALNASTSGLPSTSSNASTSGLPSTSSNASTSGLPSTQISPSASSSVSSASTFTARPSIPAGLVPELTPSTSFTARPSISSIPTISISTSATPSFTARPSTQITPSASTSASLSSSPQPTLVLVPTKSPPPPSVPATIVLPSPSSSAGTQPELQPQATPGPNAPKLVIDFSSPTASTSPSASASPAASTASKALPTSSQPTKSTAPSTLSSSQPTTSAVPSISPSSMPTRSAVPSVPVAVSFPSPSSSTGTKPSPGASVEQAKPPSIVIDFGDNTPSASPPVAALIVPSSSSTASFTPRPSNDATRQPTPSPSFTSRPVASQTSSMVPTSSSMPTLTTTATFTPRPSVILTPSVTASTAMTITASPSNVPTPSSSKSAVPSSSSTMTASVTPSTSPSTTATTTAEPSKRPVAVIQTSQPSMTQTAKPSNVPVVVPPPVGPVASNVPTATPSTSKLGAIPVASQSSKGTVSPIPTPTASTTTTATATMVATPSQTNTPRPSLVVTTASVAPSSGGSSGGSGGGGGGGGAAASASPTTTISASPSTSVSSGVGTRNNGGSVCFPGDALVSLARGGTRRMDMLRVGDRVSAGPGVESEVYGFSHDTRTAKYRFVALHTTNGSLVATALHHVYTGRGTMEAGSVRVGDTLVLADGEHSLVTSVTMRWGRGLYNPHTETGRIVVNGFLVSTYTGHVAGRAAQAALTPFRVLHACGARHDMIAKVLSGGLYSVAQSWVA